MFFNKIRSKLINLIGNQLDEMNLAKIQFILWLKFRKQEGDKEIMIDKAFNSKITEFFKASDFNELIESMFSRIKTQVENPALLSERIFFGSGFAFAHRFPQAKSDQRKLVYSTSRLNFQKESGDQPKEQRSGILQMGSYCCIKSWRDIKPTRADIEYQTLHQ